MKLMNFLEVTDGMEMTIEEYFESIKKFRTMRYIQYLINFNDILMYLVNPHFTSDYINEDVFNCIDSDKDGFISYDEW